MNPTRARPPAGRYLSMAERETLLELWSRGVSATQIGRRLGRATSTVTRELRRGTTGAGSYRPSVGQRVVDRGRRRPRRAKLATNLRLRTVVQGYLAQQYSPEQIAGRLKVDHPDDPEMRVSAETIYQSIYIQGRGALSRELAKHLRTGRSMRKPHRVSTERRGRIADMILIADRPAEVADRAVPGHWEGDLIMGSARSNSAVGTLVERTTGFVMLLHLPGAHDALSVQQALVAKLGDLPDLLRRSLTWDQGREMANHAAIAAQADIAIYFCDPHSPWQRPTNENTNGLLRQYLPKGTDLSFYGPGMLDHIATQLNHRPRKRHGFLSPAEVLDKLLTEDQQTHDVA